MKKMIEIKNLVKKYGDLVAVSNLSLDVYEGEIFGFIGPNGAGKSTTINSIMNLINKTSGDVLIDGEIFEKNNIEIIKKIGYLPSEINLYDDLTVKELLDYSDSFYDFDTSLKRKKLVEMLQLDECKKIEDLSLGNLKKVGIVLALMHDPKIIILDEPTSGLDPIMQEVFYKILLLEKQNGNTIFYSTHILSELNKICDRVGILKNGKFIKIENIDDVINNKLEYVTVISSDINNIKKEIKNEIVFASDNTIKFIYKDDFNKLIKFLSKYDIDKLLIEDAKIEDIFMHYYE